MKRYSVDLDLKFFASFRVFRGKGNVTRSNSLQRANLLIIVAGLSAGSAT
jgi:hypothetical protein